MPKLERDNKRDLGFDIQAPHFSRRRNGDFGDLFGIGVVVDVGVGQGNGVLGQQQNIHGRVDFGARGLAYHLVDETQVIGISAHGTAHHAVGIAQMHHHGADKRQAAAHFDARHFLADAAPAHQFPVGSPVAVEAFVVLGIGHFDILPETQAQAEFLDAGGQHGGSSDQNRLGNFFVDDDLHRAQHALVFAFGEDDAGSCRLREPVCLALENSGFMNEPERYTNCCNWSA